MTRCTTRIPFNHIAFLGIAKLIQAASAHFLKEWIHVEHKPLAVVLFWMLLTAGAVLLVIERPGSRPGFGTWKVIVVSFSRINIQNDVRLIFCYLV